MLGVLGGGQLGQMFCREANKAGYQVAVFSPNSQDPAQLCAQKNIVASYENISALKEFSNYCQAATIEFENIPVSTLNFLSEKIIIQPPPNAVLCTQNRIEEKKMIVESGLETAKYIAIENDLPLDTVKIMNLLPGIIKSTSNSYDGKGQATVSNIAEFKQEINNRPKGSTHILEKKVDFEKELSVVLARTNSRQVIFFPVVENIHSEGILEITLAPANISNKIAEKAKNMAKIISEKLDYFGIMCVEMFLLDSGDLLVNEIAPRPHNSGHYSLDACTISQFELQWRCLCNMPCPEPELLKPSAMINILGKCWEGGDPSWNLILDDSRLSLYLYGKEANNPKRKMGHITILGNTLDEVKNKVQRIQNVFSRSIAS